MMKVKIETRLKQKRAVILDGSMGALLMSRGIEPGKPVYTWNIEKPSEVFTVHCQYVESGAEIILTNTFSINPQHVPRKWLEKAIDDGVGIARRAARGKAYVAGDVGPLGILVEPFGDFPFEEAYRNFLVIARCFRKAKPDLMFIETFTSMVEAKAAFLAMREVGVPIVVTGSFQNDHRTVCGDIPEAWAVTFENLGAVAVGVNCSPPETSLEVIKRMRGVTNLPLVAKPNKGIPRIRRSRTVWSLSDEAVANFYEMFIKAGATMIGGCCGTTAAGVRLISRRDRRIRLPVKHEQAFISSSRKILALSVASPTLIVGERLNPSGRKTLRDALEAGNTEIYGNDARLQEEAGADGLDVNAFHPAVDEKETLFKAVAEVYRKSSLPLFIDTQQFEAAEKVLRFYAGIGVLNSVPARRSELDRWLPMIKKYGFKVVVSLVGKDLPKDLSPGCAIYGSWKKPYKNWI